MKSKINVIILLAIIFSVILIGSAGAAYDNWDYRRSVNVTESSGSNLINYQLLLTLDTTLLISSGKMQADCDDIRFTDSDESTELLYWLESGCNTSYTKVWVKVPSLTANSSRILYMHYGNVSVGTESNGTETFVFFDDFFGSSLDTAKWTQHGSTGSVTVSNGELTISNTGAGTDKLGIYSNINHMFHGKVLETRSKNTQGRHSAVIGFADSPYNPYPHGDSVTDGVSWYSRADIGTSAVSIASGINTLGNEEGNIGTAYSDYKIGWLSDTSVKIYRNNVLAHEFVNSDLIHNSALPVYFSNDGYSGSAVISVVDNVKVREYVSSEPNSIFGSEESNNTAPITFTVGGIELMYRKLVNVTENSGSSLTDYQILLTVDTSSLISAGKMQIDCGDIRFTDSDESTELSYWLESGCNTASTKVWIKASSLTANSSRTFYMYYSNSIVDTKSNGTATFDIFDDFSGSSLDTAKWTQHGSTGSVTVSNGELTISNTGAGTDNLGIYSNINHMFQGKVLETRSKNTQGRHSAVIGFAESPYDPYPHGDSVTNGVSWYVRADVGTSTVSIASGINTQSNEEGNIGTADSDYKIEWLSDTSLKIYRNDVLAHEFTNPDIIHDSALPVYFSNDGWYSGAVISVVDNVRVRKYASSEPTHTIGSEQQNIAVGCTDSDEDGYGAEGTNLTLCNYTQEDCNDTNVNIYPGATEIKNNGIDENCDGADATAVYILVPDFLDTSEMNTYYVGDDINYRVTLTEEGIYYDPTTLMINLTDDDGIVFDSHTLLDMTKISTGIYEGVFYSSSYSARPDSLGQGIRLGAWAYDNGNFLDSGVHFDQNFPDGTAPSLSSTTYTITTNAISNYTVKNLVVNSTEAKIDWSESTLDLHARNIDLDSALTIGDRSAYLDSAAYSELNDSATLTFYDVNCASAFVFYSETATTRTNILAENKQCLPPRCTDIQCAGSTLTVTVSSFTGYAAESDANLSIDADDPKFAGAEVHFTADYRNVTDDSPISGATCTIYFTDGNYPMAEGASIYTYNRTFVTEGLKDYNVTCSKGGFSTLTAFDNATITSVEIPEFSTMTLGLGLIAVLIGLIVMRKKEK